MMQNMGLALNYSLEQSTISLLSQRCNVWKVGRQVAPSSHSGYKPFQVYTVPFARETPPRRGCIQNGCNGGGVLAVGDRWSGEVSTRTLKKSKCSKPVKRGLSW